MMTSIKANTIILVTSNWSKEIRTVEKVFKKYFLDSRGEKWKRGCGESFIKCARSKYDTLRGYIATPDDISDIEARSVLIKIHDVVSRIQDQNTKLNSIALDASKKILEQLLELEGSIHER